MIQKTDYRFEAHSLIASGISVGPLKIDGSKLPKIRWKAFQDRFMTPEEVEKHFFECGGVFAITGSISRLFNFDFDLKYCYTDEDTYEKFIEKVPDALKAKLSINRTRSGGMHLWCRTNYTDKSRKITRRLLTLSELTEKVSIIMSAGANEKTALALQMKHPFQVTLETRGNGSYGVLLHPDYNPIQRTNGEIVTIEEMEFLLSIGFSLDCGFVKREQKYIGESSDYGLMMKFNEDCSAQDVLKMLEISGLYTSAGEDHKGDIMIKRLDTNAHHSGYIYSTGIVKIFGTNLFSTDKDVLSAFDIYREINDFTMNQAIQKIKEKYNERK